jgi:hypothetical protein
MNGYRKAALALASLGDADRAWMLERLPEPQRARIAPLLDELREMHVPFDRELLKQVAQESPDPTDTGALLPVLEQEPDWLIALILRARAWPWRAEFLQRIGVERQISIQRALPGRLELRPKLVAALLAALETRAREQPGERWDAPQAAPKPSWRARLPWRR